ncbi:hypothetical protein ACWFMI_23900 [Nocardiopsis terrae]|uniref:hypothetical protein n=1 Tax=Streptomyces sp. NPDC057554 TaxID=3350538 RepID=UPI0036C30510
MSFTPSAPEQIRTALAATARSLESHQRAAVDLILSHNHGWIVEEPAWLDAFVSVSSAGHAYIKWDRLGLALDRDPVLAEGIRDAVRPYSDTERSIMRVASDLGSDRWLTVRFDHNTREEVVEAVEVALRGGRRGSSHSNVILGDNFGSAVQADTIHGGRHQF